ncbi:pilus assembly FimT family protein [Desulfopila inferna]|uniref:pilus assembly FimT family protein n=1 Tax=Desulfopila inferna TaxID=468528 RepID=UPI00196618DC|nr:type II secretion system protein [Desulfopila inferna]MBM9603168.1 type II secretion system protein [Desulfopila inferna]
MNKNGFSLIEVNVCCILVAILSAVSYPFIGEIRQSAIFKNEIRMLYGNLQRAKIEAIKKNSYVVFTVNNGGYFIFVDDGAGGGVREDWIRQQNEKILTAHVFSDTVKMAGTTFPGGRTRFSGKMGVSGGRVILQSKSGSRSEVVVSLLGRIRVAKI